MYKYVLFCIEAEEYPFYFYFKCLNTHINFLKRKCEKSQSSEKLWFNFLISFLCVCVREKKVGRKISRYRARARYVDF